MAYQTDVECLYCGSRMTIRQRFVWPWQRWRGILAIVRGKCATCGAVSQMIGRH